MGLCFTNAGGSAGAVGDMATTMLPSRWGSAMASEPPEEDDESIRLVKSTQVFLSIYCDCCKFTNAIVPRSCYL